MIEQKAPARPENFQTVVGRVRLCNGGGKVDACVGWIGRKKGSEGREKRGERSIVEQERSIGVLVGRYYLRATSSNGGGIVNVSCSSRATTGSVYQARKTKGEVQVGTRCSVVRAASMVRSSTMEQTFYEDTSVYGAVNRENNVSQLKRNLTLDLNGCQRQGPQAKRPRLGPLPPALNNVAPILSSPDLNMLKLGSPELEKFIIAQQDTLVTNLPTPTQILFPKAVTEAQEMYARGFVDALNELHHSDSSQEPGSIHGATYTTLEPPGSVQSTESSVSQGLVQIKDEPQTVPSVSSSPPMSPIDMENQERIKLERKRQRNRVAASKCRRRKLERISRLEDKVKLLKGENTELSAVVHRLKEHVCRLKEQVMDHVHSGCQIMTVSGQF